MQVMNTLGISDTVKIAARTIFKVRASRRELVVYRISGLSGTLRSWECGWHVQNIKISISRKGIIKDGCCTLCQMLIPAFAHSIAESERETKMLQSCVHLDCKKCKKSYVDLLQKVLL